MNRLITKNLYFEWNDGAEKAFELTKEKLCSAPVLALPRQDGTFILDTDASDVAISGILHQEQEVDGKIKIRPIAYGSKMLSATERKYGAVKAEMLAAVRFLEKFRSYLEGREFVLRVDNMALKWLKTYSMTSDIVARWITVLGAFKMRIEHRLRDKHFNADGLSKKTEHYESREEYDKNRPDVVPGFAFMDQDHYDQLETVSWLDKDGREKPDDEKLSVKKCGKVATSPTDTMGSVQVRVLKKGEIPDAEQFPVTITTGVEAPPGRLAEVEKLALAKIVKADSPFVSPVIRDDEPSAVELPTSQIVALCAESLNAGGQEGALELIKAVKLVNAATYSISDLRRAQCTDLITVAPRKRREHPTKPPR